jgi:hypothetical protein
VVSGHDADAAHLEISMDGAGTVTLSLTDDDRLAVADD